MSYEYGDTNMGNSPDCDRCQEVKSLERELADLRATNAALTEELAGVKACFPAPLTHGQTLAKRALLAKQMKQVNGARGYTVACAGCDKLVPLVEARKCHWCGCWYGRCCSDVHFGANPDKGRITDGEAALRGKG